MFENRIYAIVDETAFQSNLSAIDLDLLFSKIIETDITTLRHSVCGDPKFIVKASNTTDIAYLTARAEELNVPYELYSHSGILEVLATSAWSLPIDGIF